MCSEWLSSHPTCLSAQSRYPRDHAPGCPETCTHIQKCIPCVHVFAPQFTPGAAHLKQVSSRAPWKASWTEHLGHLPVLTHTAPSPWPWLPLSWLLPAEGNLGSSSAVHTAIHLFFFLGLLESARKSFQFYLTELCKVLFWIWTWIFLSVSVVSSTFSFWIVLISGCWVCVCARYPCPFIVHVYVGICVLTCVFSDQLLRLFSIHFLFSNSPILLLLYLISCLF